MKTTVIFIGAILLFCLAEFNSSHSRFYTKPGNSIFSKRVMTYTNAVVKEYCRTGYNAVREIEEATSTNGEEVLRFKRPLFSAAISQGVEVLPITINYRSIGIRDVTIHNRDILFWYGDMTFLDHFWNMMKCSNIRVELTSKEKILPTGHDMTSLAQTAHHYVSECYTTIA